MADFTQVTGTGPSGGLLETIAITDQTAASTAVSKVVRVPTWARYATFVVDLTTIGGTSPTFDFVIKGVIPTYSAGHGIVTTSNDFALGAGWDGITQKTAASTAVIYIGPDLTTDDTGSATADDGYSIAAPLPGVLKYTYTTTDSADDADYAATITVLFSK